MIKIVTALLTVGTLATAAIPAQAVEDNNVIQDSQSTTIVTGNGNRTVQTTDQFVYQHRQNRGAGSNGIVQAADQYSDTYGNDNDTRMQTTQTVVQQRYRSITTPQSRY